jgi:maltose O-acetyltransferase
VISYLRGLYGQLKAQKKEAYLQELQRDGLRLGKNVSIVDDFFFDRAHCYLISIGDNTILAPCVRLVAHDASTKLYLGYTRFGKIDIGANCFLGHSVTVLCGVTIGANSIIGAGSIVTTDIPPNSVAVGAPAKVIMSLEDYMARHRVDPSQVFGEQYHIWNLDDKKRKELLDAAERGGGYIV